MTSNGPYDPGNTPPPWGNPPAWPQNPPGYPPGGYGYVPPDALPYPEHWPYPGQPAPPVRPKASGVDLVLTWTLGIVTAGAACLYLLWSLFGLMALDACSVRQCNMGVFGLAYLFGWGGSLTAVLLVALWAPRARHRNKQMWPRAAVGPLLIAASVAAWAALGTAAIPLISN